MRFAEWSTARWAQDRIKPLAAEIDQMNEFPAELWEDLSIDGWAFEARVYAEDVPKGFLPATGRLDHLRFPDGSEFGPGSVRIDSGVRQGDEISPWYDPMIAKVIVHGPTRTAALNMLTTALEGCQVTGSVTNLEFLGALSRHDGFGRGEVDTGLIARDLDILVADAAPSRNILALAALGGLGLVREGAGTDPWDRLAGWRQWTDAKQYVSLDAGDSRIEAQVTRLSKGLFEIEADGGTVRLGVMPLGGSGVRVELEDRQLTADLLREPTRVSVFLGGRSYTHGLPDALADAETVPAGGDIVIAPMPGLVRSVLTKTGASVSKGDPMLVLEAMKMEHTLRAPRDGVVAELLVAEGDQVTDGTLLVQLEEEAE
jgi:3-methylcrotonyl-CoA carboxylase alpha subunit